MRVLGLSCGQRDGSAEILLKAALMAAEEHGLEAAHVRLDELRLPSGPAVGEKTDDADWFMEHYLEADALIASTPIYTRALPGPLKVLIDRVLGPKLDVVMAEKALSSGGPEELSRREGTCPVCHLGLIVLRETHVECGTCGARGRFRTEGDRISVEFPPEGIRKSLFTIEEKRSHSAELGVNAADGPDSDEVERHAGAYREYGRAARPQEVISEW